MGKVEYTYGWYSASVGNNYIQLIISKLKAGSILYVRFIDICYAKLKLPKPN
jgi:hypothetical protein